MPRSARANAALAIGLWLAVAAMAWWAIAVLHMPAVTFGERVLMGFGAWTLLNWAIDAADRIRRTARRR